MTIHYYQFPISHYCEKGRWALDHHGVDYQLVNLLPGPHRIQTKKMAPRSQVPILTNGNQTIQGSDHIITYLDGKNPSRSLTPTDPEQREQVAQWETLADRQIGKPVRALLYNIILEHPKECLQMMTSGKSPLKKMLFRPLFPILAKVIRKQYRITPQYIDEHKNKLDTAIETLSKAYQERPYLVGDQFTRADLSVAALFAPICQPPQHPLDWARPTSDIKSFVQPYLGTQLCQRVLELYAQHRQAQPKA